MNYYEFRMIVYFYIKGLLHPFMVFGIEDIDDDLDCLIQQLYAERYLEGGRSE